MFSSPSVLVMPNVPALWLLGIMPFNGPALAHRPLFLMSLPMDNSPYWVSPPLQLTLNEQQPIHPPPHHHHPSIYPPTPPPIRPCPQPLLSTVHLIHSRRYWFSVGKIKKAMNFNAFCLSLSLPLSVIPPIHLFSTPSSPDPSLCCVLSWGKDKGEGDGTVMEGRGGGVGGVALGHFSFLNPGRSRPPPFLLTSLLIAGTIRMETRNDPSGRSSLIPCVWLYTSLCYLN